MTKKSVQPQDKYVLRLPEGLRDRIRDAALNNNRSMNAEIIARLEKYPRLAALQPEVLYVNNERESLQYRLNDLIADNHSLINVIAENSRQEVDNGKNKSVTELVSRIHDELAKLSEINGRLEVERRELIKERREALECLREANMISIQLLETFRKIFLAAASGDDKGLQLLINSFANSPNEE